MKYNIKKKLYQSAPWALGIALIGIILYLGDLSRLDEIWKAQPAWLALAIACTALHIQLSGVRWKSILLAIHPYRNYPRGFFNRAVLLGLMSGLLVTQEVGLAATRLTMIKSATPVSTEQSIFSITFDRLLDFLLMLLLGLVSLPFVFKKWGMLDTFWATLAVMAGFILSAQLPASVNPMLIVTRLYAWLLRQPYLARFVSANDTGINIYQLEKSALLRLNLLTGTRLVLLIARSAFVALAFRLNHSFLIFWIATPLSLLTLLIGFFPGGLGVVDLSLYALLVASGSMNESDATLFAIGNRLFTILSLILLFTFDFIYEKIQPHFGENTHHV